MVHFIVALKAEARPLLRHFGMTRSRGAGSMPIYTSASARARLTVSGVGEPASSAAVRAAGTGRPVAFLNVGIAGHRDLEPGTPLMIHKVTGARDGSVHYPAFPFSPPCRTDTLITVAEPELDYPESCAYDMEGSAYFAAATAASGNELAHALKVISDNPRHPTSDLSAQAVEELVGAHLPLLDKLATTLAALAAQVATRHQQLPLYGEIAGRWHLTHTQRHQLHRLLQRLQALAPDEPARVSAELNDGALRSGRDVIAFLQHRVRELPFSLP